MKPENWHVTCRRVEDTTGVWLETSHDQFAASHGVRYNRRLFVDTTDEDLRGEDMLMPASSKSKYIAARFHLRFHLHPQVSVPCKPAVPAYCWCRMAVMAGSFALRRKQTKF